SWLFAARRCDTWVISERNSMKKRICVTGAGGFTVIDTSGSIHTPGAVKTITFFISGTEIIDASANFANVGTISCGVITSTEVNTIGVFKVDGTQVVSNQGAAIANATDAATTQARLNDLLAACRTHGLINT
ncbi:hypothetical protein LCGC14_2980950, partial [marine sediment metagenome]